MISKYSYEPYNELFTTKSDLSSSAKRRAGLDALGQRRLEGPQVAVEVLGVDGRGRALSTHMLIGRNSHRRPAGPLLPLACSDRSHGGLNLDARDGSRRGRFAPRERAAVRGAQAREHTERRAAQERRAAPGAA